MPRTTAKDSLGLYPVSKDGGKYSFKFKDENGKWHSKATGTGDLKTAFKVKSDFEDRRSRQTSAPPQPAPDGDPNPAQNNQLNELQCLSLRKAADRWLGLREAMDIKRSTLKHNRQSIKRLIEVFGETKQVKTFTRQDLSDYIVARRKEPSDCKKKRVGPRAVNLEVQVLRQILDDADLWPLPGKKYKPLDEPSEKVSQVLNPAQLQKLISFAGKKDGWFVAFHAAILAYGTGCRSCEIRNLRLENIQLDRPVPTLSVKKSKTRRGIRDIPLTAAAQWALRQLLQRAWLLGARDGEDYLLPLDNSKRTYKQDPKRGTRGYDVHQPQTSFRKAWTSLRRAAGLPTFRFHDFRSCALSNYAEAGVPLAVVQDLAGHTSPTQTSWYITIQQQPQVKATQAVEAHVGDAFQGLINSQLVTTAVPKTQ